jgi:L-amino acid N-acyltransferase YncA
MPPGFTLRPATAADLPAIVEIYNATIPGRMVTADTEPVTVASREPWFQAHNPQTRPLWVLGDDSAGGRVCAWLSFNSFYGRPAYNPTAEVSLYVALDYRCRGLGKALVKTAIAEAPDCGVDTLLGFIWAHNEPSRRLFARHGFEEWGRLPRVAVLDGIDRDLVIVGLRVAN